MDIKLKPVDDPTVTLRFRQNASTPSEGPIETIASYRLKPDTFYDGLWTMGERETVVFPTGDALELYAEADTHCNQVTLYSGTKRLVSWNAASDVHLMFLLPSGQEAYVSINVHGNLAQYP